MSFAIGLPAFAMINLPAYSTKRREVRLHLMDVLLKVATVCSDFQFTTFQIRMDVAELRK